MPVSLTRRPSVPCALLILLTLSSLPCQAQPLALTQSPKTNSGVIRATNGGIVEIYDRAAVTQTSSGLIDAEAGSAVLFREITISGGALASSGDGVVAVNGSEPVLDGVAILAGSKVQVPCFRSVKLSGTINNAGTLLVDNRGCGPNFATLRADTAVSLIGTGAVRLYANGDGAPSTLDGGAVGFSFAATQKITGSGRLAGRLTAGLIDPDRTFGTPGPAGVLTANAGAGLRLVSASTFHVDLAALSDFDRINGAANITLGGALDVRFAAGPLIRSRQRHQRLRRLCPRQLAARGQGPRCAGGSTTGSRPAADRAQPLRRRFRADVSSRRRSTYPHTDPLARTRRAGSAPSHSAFPRVHPTRSSQKLTVATLLARSRSRTS